MRTVPETVITVDHEGLAKAFLCTQVASGKKAENIRILDLRESSGFTDFFLVCSARSDRQAKAIADALTIELKEQGVAPISIEGYSDGRWIVVDYGDLVVHVFLDALRDFYDLEHLWKDSRRVAIPSELYLHTEYN